VLVVRYGEEAGRLEVGGRSDSSWWREVANIRDGIREEGEGWFAGMVSRRVGDGENTLFWLDRWVGNVPLCQRFSRLFNLAENKLVSVATTFSLGWEEGGAAWQWQRCMWAWEDELLAECRTLLSNVLFQPIVSDIWQWHPDIAGGYSVRLGYEILTSLDYHVLDDAAKLIWHPQVALKVSILAWCMPRDRLPTKNNLHARGIIAEADRYCVAGCGQVETVNHLFLHCDTFGSIWQQVRFWLGFSGVDNQNLADHFHQFTYYLGGLKTRRSFLHLI